MRTAISEREMPPFTAPGQTSSETAAVHIIIIYIYTFIRAPVSAADEIIKYVTTPLIKIIFFSSRPSLDANRSQRQQPHGLSKYYPFCSFFARRAFIILNTIPIIVPPVSSTVVLEHTAVCRKYINLNIIGMYLPGTLVL